ncbi:MAG TPA: redoxin domain-containing protein [Pirellulaceae bacterium]|nr:redoxin domain-containing protein [Pirellulaceae bacterium]
MRRPSCSGVCALLLLSLAGSAWGQARQPREGKLSVGDAAPDFSVKDVHGKESVRLADLKGQPVVLIFGSCT